MFPKTNKEPVSPKADRLQSKAKILEDLMGFAGKGAAEGLKSKFAPPPPVEEEVLAEEPAVEGAEAPLDLENLDPEILKQLLAELGQEG